ncbi:heavy metal translocating P-type ATPase [Gayadomonas joobiniege]|uniref:heavy metal translocating P-type ATPase n=1 Tax=Gayadomonas joobiniege TaxID=1234606 RepID=UPI0003728CAC|nr:heavy metal translocating P-type ATPase [Gayadomonas joobiniege]
MQTKCFHCDLPIPVDVDLTINFQGQKKPVCCLGCQAVAEVIIQGGLSQYYKFRENTATQPDDLTQLSELELAYDNPAIQQAFVSQSGQTYTADISLQGMHCAACAWLIEAHLKNSLTGIEAVTVNLVNQRAQISWHTEQCKLSQIFAAIRQIGYQAAPFKISEQEIKFKQQAKGYLKQLAVAGLFTMQVMMLAFALYFGVVESEFNEYFRWLSLLLATPVVFYSAKPLHISAFKALKNRQLNMDVPVVFAVMTTYIASAYATFSRSGEVYFESASMFVFLLLSSRYLEHLVKMKAVSLSANLLKILPLVAFRFNQQNQLEVCHANQLKVGEIIQVQPGQTVPADGILLNDAALFEESVISGESIPVNKIAGDTVFAGSIPAEHSVKISVTASGAATSLSQLAHHQETLQQSQNPIYQSADKIARQATLMVLLLSVLTYVGWTLAGENGLWYAVAVLVATCPCALSLALPTAVSASAAALKKSAILLQHSRALELIDKSDFFAFDKTGTLTNGRFKIHQLYWLDKTMNTSQILSLTAAIEQQSSHPLASAFSDIAHTHQVENFTVLPSVGLTAKVDGYQVIVGARSLLPESIHRQYPDAQIFVIINGKPCAALVLTDELKDDAPATLKSLDKPSYILSGDSSLRVQQTAKTLQTGYYQGLSANEKVRFLQALQNNQKIVTMLGDGVNDAPVLAAADVSIVMHEGADLTRYKADVVFLNSNISALTNLIKKSRHFNQIVNQNYTWALLYNLTAVPLAVAGILTPWMAALGMSVSSLIVVSNSMRLLRS